MDNLGHYSFYDKTYMRSSITMNRPFSTVHSNLTYILKPMRNGA